MRVGYAVPILITIWLKLIPARKREPKGGKLQFWRLMFYMPPGAEESIWLKDIYCEWLSEMWNQFLDVCCFDTCFYFVWTSVKSSIFHPFYYRYVDTAAFPQVEAIQMK